MAKHKAKKKDNKLYVVQQTEKEIKVDDLLQEYENLSEDEQELLNQLADIRERKEEIKAMVGSAAEEVDEETKSSITGRINSAEPSKGKPTQKRNFNQAQ